jgi:hypothetical protein
MKMSILCERSACLLPRVRAERSGDPLSSFSESDNDGWEHAARAQPQLVPFCTSSHASQPPVDPDRSLPANQHPDLPSTLTSLPARRDGRQPRVPCALTTTWPTTTCCSPTCLTCSRIFTIASLIPPPHPSSEPDTGGSDPRTTENSKRPVGGGSFSPRPHRLADFEEYELADYTGIEQRQKRDTRYFERQTKRAEKIRELEEADEMKFSHSIQFNAVPDWSSHYIAYSNLKKL